MKWIYISLAAFLLSLVAVVFLIMRGPSLIGSDKAIVYYIVLFPLAASAAVFLSKTLRSYASLKGSFSNYRLALGGPVVVFALVIGGGYYFYQHPPSASFNLPVIVQDDANPARLLTGSLRVIFKSGRIENAKFQNANQIVVTDVSAGDSLQIIPDIAGYVTSSNAWYKIPAPGRSLTIRLQKDIEQETASKRSTGRFLVVINEYLNDARDLARVLDEDLDAIFQRDENAVGEVVKASNHYDKSYRTYNSSKDSLSYEIAQHPLFNVSNDKNLQAADIAKDIISKIDNLHRSVFLVYSNDYRVRLNKYLNDELPASDVKRLRSDIQSMKAPVEVQLELLKGKISELHLLIS
jgi:hypothetical protein